MQRLCCHCPWKTETKIIHRVKAWETMKRIVLPISVVSTWLCVAISLYGDSAVLPDVRSYDLSGIPPSATEMLREERKGYEAQSIKSIKKIVDDAVAKKNGQSKKGVEKKTKKSEKSPTKKALKTALNTLMQQSALSQEMIDILEKQLDDPELAEKTISIHLKKMPFKDALAVVSKSSGIQLVVDGDVTGDVQELKFDNVPVAAALHSILTCNEPRLTIMKDFGVWRIMKMQTAREMFAGMAAREREKDFSAAIVSMMHAKWNDALKTRIEKLWQGITQGNNCNNDKHNTYLILDDVNKKIFFKARKAQVQEFERYLREIDIKIPQIRIDARVVLASKDFEDSLGFNWSGVYNQRASVNHVDFVGLGPFETNTNSVTGAPNPTAGNPASATTTPFSNIAGWALNLVPSTAKSLITIPFVFGNNDLNTKRLNLTLNAAESRSDLKTILKPSMLVYNEECAEILVGQELPQEVRLDETIETRLTNITTVNYKDVGMKIRVKPVVTPDHEAVFLDVFVENSVIAPPDFELIQGAPIGAAGVGSRRSSFNYTIRTSRSQNRVLLKSGNTTMISGLISNTQDKQSTGVPFLQDIPLLGFFFRWSAKQVHDRQLLVFITPTLVDG